MTLIKLLAPIVFLCAACGGSLSGIPIPTGGSITITDAGATVCTTIPLAAAVEAGVAR